MLRKAIFWGVLFLLAQPVRASEVDLIVSEIMYDVSGADSGKEWVEIYNSGAEEVSLNSSWRFFDGSNHNINFYQGTSTIASREYFILADNGANFLLDYPNYLGTVFDTVINLANSSSSLALSFDEGASYALEDYYDSTWGANGNGYSLEKIDLQINDNGDWQESAELGGTPGQINSQGPLDNLPDEDEAIDDVIEEDTQPWEQLIINEFLPNPVGSDDNEWIELYNNGPEILNLEGLKIKDNSTRIFTLDVDSGVNLYLLANNYLLLPKSVTGISLNNSSDEAVIIMQPNQEVIQTVNYNGVIEGRSYASSEQGFVWTKTPTPGVANQILINQAPVAQISIVSEDFVLGEKISFSAANSYDPEEDDLDYLWDFGDGETSTKKDIKYAYEKLGSYTVRLTVTDPEGASNQADFNLEISQNENEKEETNKKVEVSQSIVTIDLSEDDLIISELIPNPVGSDDNEWIELYNASDKDIDLYAWQLDDQDGGSKPYIFASSTVILAKDFLVLDRTQTKITLNNTSDAVRILTPSGDIWQEVKYEKIPEGQSYAWDLENREWFMGEASPNNFNMAIQSQELVHAVYEIKDLEKESTVLVQGIVLNRPDKNTRSVYLADWNRDFVDFSQILEVYFYNKDFPQLNAGDLVTVSGEISNTSNLPRLKIKSAEQIVSSGVNVAFDKAEAIMADNIDQDFLGQFVTVQGVVTKKSGKNIYIAGDLEDEAQLRAYADFSLGDLEIKKGLEIIVSGILTSTDSGFKLLPFSLADISVAQEVLGEKIASSGEGIDLVTSTNEVFSSDRKIKIKNILFFLMGALLLIVVGYFVKKKYKREAY